MLFLLHLGLFYSETFLQLLYVGIKSFKRFKMIEILTLWPIGKWKTNANILEMVNYHFSENTIFTTLILLKLVILCQTLYLFPVTVDKTSKL